MIGNLLGEVTEEAAMEEATHVSVPRFDVRAAAPPSSMTADEHAEWLRMWDQMSLVEMHGFPVWDKEVHDMLAANLSMLHSIFFAYAFSSLQGAANLIDLDELQVGTCSPPDPPAPPHTRTHTRTNTHILTLSPTLSPTLSLSLSLTHAYTRTRVYT